MNNNYLILINKNNPIKNEDMFTKTKYINAFSDEIIIEEQTLKAFLKLKNDMLKLGINIDLDSGYRSIREQKNLELEFISTKGKEYTKKYVAKPKYSEHHTGLAIDIIIIKNNKPLNDSQIFDNPEIKIIHENLYKYGFILRYPKNKEDITGVSYEPWHFRFINDINIAKHIYEFNICLEEYLSK